MLSRVAQLLNLDEAEAPVVLALIASLAVHLAGFGVYRIGQAHNWWDMSIPFLEKLSEQVSSLFLSEEKIEESLEQQQLRQQREQEEVPMIYVDVLPMQATEDAPEETRFYSALNSRAANPEPGSEEKVPQIDGDQTRIVKSVDVPVPITQPTPATPQTSVPENEPQPSEPRQEINPDRLQPSQPQEPEHEPEPPEPQALTPPETVPDPPESQEASPEGDLQLARRNTTPQETREAQTKTTEKQPAPRPRTLAQARALQPQAQATAGEKMKQEGGARRRGLVPSFDTKATPFGTYDAMIITAIQQRWFQLLDQQENARNWAGYVVVSFRLYYDGRVTFVEIEKNTSGPVQGLLCQKAIVDNAPFAKWPSDLRLMVNRDYRELRFTFYYN